MKTTQIAKTACFIALLFAFSKICNAQTTASAIHQKDYIGENPNADRDLQIVSEYLNALAAGDFVKVKSSAAPGYKSTGPGPKDSADIDADIKSWTENVKTQTARKFSFVMQSFRVLTGDLTGNWVAVWGDYTFTLNSVVTRIPFQFTARISNDGKIINSITYWDKLSMFEGLGFKLVPPPAPKTTKKSK